MAARWRDQSSIIKRETKSKLSLSLSFSLSLSLRPGLDNKHVRVGGSPDSGLLLLQQTSRRTMHGTTL